MRQHTVVTAVLVLILSAHPFAQGLFESALSGDTGSTSGPVRPGFDIGGHVKASVFGGRDNDHDPRIMAANTQLSLKLTAEKQELGKAYAELRLDAGATGGALTVDPDLREAWVAAYPGPLDIRLGKQIVAWGRADGINPTNNITPMNNLAYSSELDDTRQGNLLARCRLNLPHAGIEAVWIPVFAADALLIDETMVPEGVVIRHPRYPGRSLANCGYAARVDLSFPAVDGSVSYFNGYETQPGFDYELTATGMTLIPRAYRIHAVGADFSTALGSLGVRGEAAAELPYDDYDRNVYVPNPSVHGVLGLDRTVRNWEFLVQYSGRYVVSFEELAPPLLTNPGDLLAQMQYLLEQASTQIEDLNRLFVGNADKFSHTLTARAGLNLLHETLRAELAGMYNVTTEEYAVNPRISYDITDAFTVTAGGRYLGGPDNSLNDLVGTMLSWGYTEIRLSF